MKYGLPNDVLVQTWHKKFIQTGIQWILPKPKGRPSMSNKKNSNQAKKTRTREQKLEHENELLRTEFAFLKKLRALDGISRNDSRTRCLNHSRTPKKIQINGVTGGNQISQSDVYVFGKKVLNIKIIIKN